MKWGILATGTIAKKFASTVEQMGAEGERLVAALRRQIRCTGIFHLPLLHDFQTHRRTGQQQFPAA